MGRAALFEKIKQNRNGRSGESAQRIYGVGVGTGRRPSALQTTRTQGAEAFFSFFLDFFIISLFFDFLRFFSLFHRVPSLNGAFCGIATDFSEFSGT